jgi:hypothetical protein
MSVERDSCCTAQSLAFTVLQVGVYYVRNDCSSCSISVILLGLCFCDNEICSGEFPCVARVHSCGTKPIDNNVLFTSSKMGQQPRRHHNSTAAGCSCEDRNEILSVGSFEDPLEYLLRVCFLYLARRQTYNANVVHSG